MAPMLGAKTLGLSGGFNVLGRLFFGWAGGRWNKLALLGSIYLCRSLVLAWYFMLPPSPATTLVFGAFMGFLWLRVRAVGGGAGAARVGPPWAGAGPGRPFLCPHLGHVLR